MFGNTDPLILKGIHLFLPYTDHLLCPVSSLSIAMAAFQALCSSSRMVLHSPRRRHVLEYLRAILPSATVDGNFLSNNFRIGAAPFRGRHRRFGLGR